MSATDAVNAFQEMVKFPEFTCSQDILSSPSSSLAYLTAVQAYLQGAFPGILVMPARKGGKAPRMRHKNNAYTLDTFNKKGKFCCEHGALLVLTRSLIIVDIDDKALAREYETHYPEFGQTVTTSTSKGMHFYFRRPDDADTSWINDGCRQLGEDLPVDIKTGSNNPAKTANGVISIPPSPGKEYVRPLGICNVAVLPTAFIEFMKSRTRTPESTQKSTKPQSQSQTKSTKTSSQTLTQNTTAQTTTTQTTTQTRLKLGDGDLSEVDTLLSMLSLERAVSRTPWLHVGFCLHNISSDPALLERWLAFSSRSPANFEPDECQRQWAAMEKRQGGLGFGSLHYWARSDSPERYRAYMMTRLSSQVEACAVTHNAVAEIASKVLKGLFVCASSDSKLWYSFDGALWREEKSALGVHRALASQVRQVFIHAISRLRAVLRENEDDESSSSRAQGLQATISRLMSIAGKLQNDGFKSAVIKVMREYMYDSDFLKRLDSNMDLLAFDNGVFCLSEGRFRMSTPEDLVSLSVGYDYDADPTDPDLARDIDTYFAQMHPDADQRSYIIKMFARQLYGDPGSNYVHVHAGVGGTGANGKTCFFQLLGHILGEYVNKFGVEMLTAKERIAAGKPMPEFSMWRGRRIIYCTEPNSDEKLNSGILKDLSGGEIISYRMLYCNDINEFTPQFKMHLLTNDAPRLDGADKGVARRVRKIDYVSQFVAAADVDTDKHRFPKDDRLLRRAEGDPSVKLAFMKILLNAFEKGFDFELPAVIQQSSREYLSDNDTVLQFVAECIEKVTEEDDDDEVTFFTLKEAKERAPQEGVRATLAVLKHRLEEYLDTPCLGQKKINGDKYSNVFMGWRLKPKGFKP